MLAIAMANRNSAETSVPTTPPKLLNASNRPCSAVVADRDGDRQRDDDRRMAEREEQADRDRPAAFLHQFAGHVVDRRDVIGVERVPQAETVSERRRAEQHWIIVEGDDRPQPCGDVGDEQEQVDRDDLAPNVVMAVVEEIG